MSQLFSDYLVEPNSPPPSPSLTFIVQVAEVSGQTNQSHLVEVHNYLNRTVLAFWRYISDATSQLRKLKFFCINRYRDCCEEFQEFQEFQVDLRRCMQNQITILSQLLENYMLRLKRKVLIHLVNLEVLPN